MRKGGYRIDMQPKHVANILSETQAYLYKGYT